MTIESVGTRLQGALHTPPPVGRIDRETMDRLAAAVASVGGTRDAFNTTAVRTGHVQHGGLVYALVGWKRAEPGQGAELSSDLKYDENGRPVAPTLSVVLRPDHQSLLRPTDVTASGGAAPDALINEVMRPASDDWQCGSVPCSKAPGVEAAMSYIGTHDVTQLGPHPRAQYGIARWNADELLGIHSGLEAVRGTGPPGGGDLFDQVDWDTAIDQLLKENAEIAIVRGYLHHLAAPPTPTG